MKFKSLRLVIRINTFSTIPEQKHITMHLRRSNIQISLENILHIRLDAAFTRKDFQEAPQKASVW
jgi:hypothetical protein